MMKYLIIYIKGGKIQLMFEERPFKAKEFIAGLHEQMRTPVTEFKDCIMPDICLLDLSTQERINYKTFLNPIKYPMLSFQLVSHKLLRWLIPIYLLVIFLVNLFLLNLLFFQIVLGLQVVFYSMAILGYALEKKHWHNILFYTPFYFCLVNIASLHAIIKYFFKRKKVVTWEPIRLKKS